MDTQLDEKCVMKTLVPFCEWSKNIKKFTVNSIFFSKDAASRYMSGSPLVAKEAAESTQVKYQIETAFRQNQSATIRKPPSITTNQTSTYYKRKTKIQHCGGHLPNNDKYPIAGHFSDRKEYSRRTNQDCTTRKFTVNKSRMRKPILVYDKARFLKLLQEINSRVERIDVYKNNEYMEYLRDHMDEKFKAYLYFWVSKNRSKL